MDKENEKEVRAVSKKKAVTIKLDEAVEWGEETVTEVKLSPPRGKHLRGLPKDPTLNDILKIASKISGISSAVFDEMASSDIMKIAEAVGELL